MHARAQASAGPAEAKASPAVAAFAERPMATPPKELRWESRQEEPERPSASPAFDFRALAILPPNEPLPPEWPEAPPIRTKLRVGHVDDPHEREADRVAAELSRSPEPVGTTAAPALQPLAESAAPAVVRRVVLTNAATPEDTAPEPEAEVEEESPAETVRRKLAQGGGDAEDSMDPVVAQAVEAPGPGRPLAEPTRQFFEPRLGLDLGRVRVHEGPSAGEAAARLNARAFTQGTHIWLGSGERESDRLLLGHELAHVVQAVTAPAGGVVRCYVRTNTVFLRDVYDAAGRDPAAVTDAQLRTTIEYEDYTRADLTWRFSDTVAIAALRRSMDLFVAGVHGRGPNYIRSGREARAAAHGLSHIDVSEVGFTGDHMIATVPTGLGGPRGPNVDDPDGSTPVWTTGGPDHLAAYTLGTAPTLFARFAVSPSVSPAVPDVRVRALVDTTLIGQATGLTMNGGLIESPAGAGRVLGIGGGSPFPGASVGLLEPVIRFETSTDGGQIWFASGSAQVKVFFTAAAPAPPGGGAVREDVLEWAGLVIGSGGSPAERLRFLVKALVTYDPTIGMPPGFATTDAVMRIFRTPHQCDSQAYLLRYLARSLGIPADVVYFWYGTPSKMWHFRMRISGGSPTFQCDRPAEDFAAFHPHFNFHALTDITGVRHDPSYDRAGLPGILERAPGAAPQTGPRPSFLALDDEYRNVICPH